MRMTRGNIFWTKLICLNIDTAVVLSVLSINSMDYKMWFILFQKR